MTSATFTSRTFNKNKKKVESGKTNHHDLKRCVVQVLDAAVLCDRDVPINFLRPLQRLIDGCKPERQPKEACFWFMFVLKKYRNGMVEGEQGGNLVGYLWTQAVRLVDGMSMGPYHTDSGLLM